VFYVTTAQTSLPFFSIGNYGHGIVNLNATSVPTIAGLVAGSIPYLTQKTPFSALIPSAGDPTEIGRYVQQGGNIKVAIGTVTPVSYQGTTLYPAGQFLNQSGAPLVAPGTKQK
jgi:hypothetical protein